MARWEESAKRREWSERLARFARWDGTVAEFCTAERVSAPSFYQWRRKLAERAEPERRARREAATFVPVQLVSAATATLDIELPNGAHVRLSAPDRQLVAAAIAAAGRAAAGRVAAANGAPSTSRGEAAGC
jgi:hypothetical protein